MAKSKEKVPEVTWVVVTSDGNIQRYATLLSAKTGAQDYLDINETTDDVYIFEVTRAWYVEFPPEPAAEVYEMSLEEL